MSQSTTPDNDTKTPPVKVVVPSPRKKWKGWVTVDEIPEPRLSVHGGAGVKENNILSRGQKRLRQRPDRFQEEHRWSLERSVTVSSRAPSEQKQQPRASRRICVGARVRTKEHNDLHREIRRLKRHNDLLAVSENSEISRLQTEVKRLEGLKAEQNRKILRLISKSGEGTPDGADTEDGRCDILQKKDQEIEQQNATIKDLESRLRDAMEFNSRLSKIEDEDLGTPINFTREMKGLELGILRAAELLSTCFCPSDAMPDLIHIHPDLHTMASKVVKNINTLLTMPAVALRGLLFNIIRDHVMYSDMWTALHVEGYVLRAYQQAIQQTASTEFVETFHKAAALRMLDDSQFKTCFLQAHVQELRSYILDILEPFLSPTKLKEKQNDLHREMDGLLMRAFVFRSRCFPPDGERYEIIQFKPGEEFDPTTMEAQDETGNQVTVPLNGANTITIKICVHGLMVGYKVEEKPSGLQRIKALSQPFESSEARKGQRVIPGGILSGKAIVVLQ